MRASLPQNTRMHSDAASLQSHCDSDVLAGKIDLRILIFFILLFIALYSELSFPLILLILVRKNNCKEESQRNWKRFLLCFCYWCFGCFFWYCCVFQSVIADSSLLSTGAEPGIVPSFQLTEIFCNHILVQGEKLNIGRMRKITVQCGGESADLGVFLSRGSSDFMGMEPRSQHGPGLAGDPGDPPGTHPGTAAPTLALQHPPWHPAWHPPWHCSTS